MHFNKFFGLCYCNIQYIHTVYYTGVGLFNTTVVLQKVKELTYLHSEGILSGELKHGPLAMIDKQMPVIMIIMKDNVYTVSSAI